MNFLPRVAGMGMAILLLTGCGRVARHSKVAARESTLKSMRSLCAMMRLNLDRPRFHGELERLSGQWFPLCELLERHRETTGMDMGYWERNLNTLCHEYDVHIAEDGILVRDKLIEQTRREEARARETRGPLQWLGW